MVRERGVVTGYVTKMLNVFIASSIWSTYPTHFILLDVITVIV